MRKRLLATDIDGTLVTKDKRLTPRTAESVRRFMENGGVFVLATGRSTAGAEPFARELRLRGFGGYLISYNGCEVTDLRSGECIFRKFLELPQLPQIFEAARRQGLPLTTYHGDMIVTERADDPYFQIEVNVNHMEVRRVASLEAEVTYPVPRFLITGEPQELDAAERLIRPVLKGVGLSHTMPYFLELVPPGVNKGSALRWLARRLGVERDELMACGDGGNDLELLRAAGVGVAMANARQPLKDAADFVTLSNEEDGLVFAMQKFIF